jgi:hypothetical protein
VQFVQPQQPVVVFAAREQQRTVIRSEIAAAAIGKIGLPNRQLLARQVDPGQPLRRPAIEQTGQHAAIGDRCVPGELRMLPTQQVAMKHQHAARQPDQREQHPDRQSDPQVQPRQRRAQSTLESRRVRTGRHQNRCDQLALNTRPRPAT